MNFITEIVSFIIPLVINFSLIGLLVTIGAAIAGKLSQGLLPRVRYVLSIIVFLFAIVAPIFATFQNERVLSNSLDSPVFSSSTNSEAVIVQNVNQTTPAPATKQLDYLVVLLEENGLGSFLFYVWIAGAVLLLTRELAGHFFLYRIRRDWKEASEPFRSTLNLSKNERIFVHEKAAPSTVGLWHPIVILSSDLLSKLPSEEINLIVQHELAHARWRDPLVNTLLRLIRAVFWLNFALWYLESVIRVEREAAADYTAVITVSKYSDISQTATEFAASLVSLAVMLKQDTLRQHYKFITTQLGENCLETRVRRLLMLSVPLTRARIFSAAVIFTACLCGIRVIPMASKPLEKNQSIVSQNIPVPLGSVFNKIVRDEPTKTNDSEQIKTSRTSENEPPSGKRKSASQIQSVLPNPEIVLAKTAIKGTERKVASEEGNKSSSDADVEANLHRIVSREVDRAVNQSVERSVAREKSRINY